ncbi:MAG: hypothetical protein WD749_11955 [Phycisphaerales bacterium]
MVKVLRKHKQWLMAGFGVLLMLAFLGGPAIEGTTKIVGNRTVGTLDGRRVRASDLSLASRELSALGQVMPVLVRGVFGIEERDSQHWMLLAEEAKQAGLVAEAGDGQEFLRRVAPEMAQMMLQQDIQLLLRVYQGPNAPRTPQEAVQRVADDIVASAPTAFAGARMNEEEMDAALAKAHGVYRMVSTLGAPRVSDRLSVTEAKREIDAAVIDYAFLPASALAASVPEPDAAALAAHVDLFKANRPGEGDYGIGYLLPPRVKLEWLTLDRKAIEAAVALDPVEVHKRHAQNRSRYPGTLEQERARVEADMRAQHADRVMQEAQLVIQAETGKATRRLERDGKYRKLPEGWEQVRPTMTAIAEAVRDQVSRVPELNIRMPLPAVTAKGEWLTQADVAALEGIARATMRVGGIEAPLHEAVFWAKELGGSENVIAVQAGIPLAEHPLSDAEGNRHYILVRETRGESEPENVEEVREEAVTDYRNLRAFEALRARADELRSAAMSGGVDAAAAAFAATPLPEGKTATKPEVSQAARVTRAAAQVMELNRDDAARTTVMEAAEKLDPKAPPDQHPVEASTLVVPTARSLGVAVVRIRALSPLTREDYVRIDRIAAMRALQAEGQAAAAGKSVFSLDAILARHEYIVGDKRVLTAREAEGQGG